MNRAGKQKLAGFSFGFQQRFSGRDGILYPWEKDEKKIDNQEVYTSLEKSNSA